MSLVDGKAVEKIFSKLLKNYNFSTTEQDINEHWDLSTQIKIDVKKLKKVRRSDEYVDENIHYVELRNVNGDSGWLYGDADYFAFETHDYFIIVDKLDLQNLIAKKVKKTLNTYPILYQLYRRRNRKDIMTLVKTIDLMVIKTGLLKKDEI